MLKRYLACVAAIALAVGVSIGAASAQGKSDLAPGHGGLEPPACSIHPEVAQFNKNCLAFVPSSTTEPETTTTEAPPTSI